MNHSKAYVEQWLTYHLKFVTGEQGDIARAAYQWFMDHGTS